MKEQPSNLENGQRENCVPEPIAIVGLACLFPDSPGLKEYWSAIKNGRDCIQDIPASHWSPEDYFDADPKRADHTYCARGAFLPPVAFDPTEFGIPPTALEATDTAQLLGMVVAKAALKDAGYDPDAGSADASSTGGEAAASARGKTFDRDHTSVILGVTGTLELVVPLGARLGHPQWRRALREAGVEENVIDAVVARIGASYVDWQENSFPGLLGNVVAGRIANRLDLGGTNCVVDAACASSLSAIHLAMLELREGRSSMVVSGGVDTFNDIFMYMCFSKTPALSPTGEARPFAKDADGTVLGEGIGMVVMKRLSDAERDGDKIYALLESMGSSSDGRSQSIYAPRFTGQARAMTNAFASAGIDPGTIELIEAHGTGTKAGDLSECKALSLAFAEAKHSGKSQERSAKWCALGSVKAQIGHTKAAAGAAGLIKAALALFHKVIPPTQKVAEPNPRLELENGPFYLPTEPRPWLPSADHPRRAGVSSFGFGGSNFHAVLREHAQERIEPVWDASVEMLPFAAASPAELERTLGSWIASAQVGAAARGRQAAILRRNFDRALPFRMVIMLAGETPAADVFAAAVAGMRGAKGQFAAGANWFYGTGAPAPDCEIAFLFPGQGSQYPGMGSDAACVFPEALETLVAANAGFAAAASENGKLTDLMYPVPAWDEPARRAQQVALTRTEVAQPALGAMALGLAKVLARFGVQPAFVAGHSYGELVALAVAGALAEADLHRLSCLRGQLMAAGGKDGAANDLGSMLAVSAARADVDALLAANSLDVVLANHNHPKQCVLSGSRAGIAAASEACRRAGYSVRELEVAAAFHSPLVAGALAPFRAALADVALSAPRIPVYANTTGEAYPASPEAARALLAEQLARPVQFVTVVENLYAAGARTFVEVGPKAVLTSLVGRTLAGREHAAISVDAAAGCRPGAGHAQLAACLAALAARGHQVTLAAWESELPEPRAQRMSVTLTGANYRDPKRAERSQPVVVPSASVRESASQEPRNPGRTVSSRVEQIALPAPTADVAAASEALRAVHEGLRAMQALQEQTAELHARFLDNQTQAQLTLQRMIESQERLALGGSAPVFAPAPAAKVAPIVAAAVPAPAPVAAPAPVLAPVPAAVASDAAQTLLEVVSELTGYPAEMLDLGMDLEADLGIDSIKRVEILAVMQERVPGLEPASAEVLGGLRTLAQVLEHCKLPEGTPSAPAVATAPQAQVSLAPVLLAVVSELTGYPAEMLDLSMDLEADLGIDSIKRVEILAVMQERVPGLEPATAEVLGSLRTLAQVLEHCGPASPTLSLSSAVPVGAAVPVSPAVAVSAAVPASPGVMAPAVAGTLATTLLAVVSELTGYPAEMLDLEMDLEADLGIDSIKRVEILAVMQERVPSIEPASAEVLGSLRTLAQVLEHCGPASPAASPSAPVMPAVAPAALVAAPAPARAARTNAAAAARNLDRRVLSQLVLPMIQAAGRKGLALASHRPIWVTDDDSELAHEVVRTLVASGLVATLVVLSAAAEARGLPALGGLILMGTPRATADSLWDPQSEADLELAFLASQSFEGALRAAALEGGALFATVSRMDGAFGLLRHPADPLQGGLAGLAKTAALEWPGVHCRAIDVDERWRDPVAAARAIVDELLAASGPMEVGLSESGRRGLLTRDEPLPATDGDLPLESGDLVVVSGGARGVTAECAVAVAQATGASLLLLGRSPEPTPEPRWLAAAQTERDVKQAVLANELNGRTTSPRELGSICKRHLANRDVLATLARLRDAGVQAQYRAVDIRNAQALGQVLDEARAKFGPVRGLIHGAGVLEDKLIAEKSLEQFRRVMSTKVTGLRALLEATAGDDLKVIALFSSMSGRFGRQGQVDYAMANEVLSKVAQSEARRRPSCRVVALGWGPWDGGMVTSSLKAEFVRQGVGVIPLEAGAAFLVSELGSGSGAVEVLVGDGFGEAPKTELSELVTLGAGKNGNGSNGNGAHGNGSNGSGSNGSGSNGSGAHGNGSNGNGAHGNGNGAHGGALVERDARPPAVACELELTPARHSFLTSHTIGGRPVLPMAMIMEWLGHGALHENPGLKLAGFDDLRLLKGVVIENGARRVQVAAGKARRVPGSAGQGLYTASVELRGEKVAGGLVHARGRALLAERLEPAASYRERAELSARPYARDLEKVYGDILFHGHDFHAIEEVEGFSAAGMIARLRSAPPPARWMQEPLRSEWLMDPLAIDAVFQMAILWCYEELGAVSLPSYLGSYRQHMPAFPSSGVRAAFEVTQRRGNLVSADVTFVDPQGQVIARIQGFQCTASETLLAAFHSGSQPI